MITYTMDCTCVSCSYFSYFIYTVHRAVTKFKFELWWISNNFTAFEGVLRWSPTAVQAWRPCPLWEPSPSHPILL